METAGSGSRIQRTRECSGPAAYLASAAARSSSTRVEDSGCRAASRASTARTNETSPIRCGGSCTVIPSASQDSMTVDGWASGVAARGRSTTACSSGCGWVRRTASRKNGAPSGSGFPGAEASAAMFTASAIAPLTAASA